MHVITPNSVPFPGSTLSDEPPSHPAVAATANLLLVSVLAVEENEKQSKCSFLRIRSTTHILPALPPNQSTIHCGSATNPPTLLIYYWQQILRVYNQLLVFASQLSQSAPTTHQATSTNDYPPSASSVPASRCPGSRNNPIRIPTNPGDPF